MTTEKKVDMDYPEAFLQNYNCFFNAPACDVCDARHFCKENGIGGVCEDTRMQFLINEGVL